MKNNLLIILSFLFLLACSKENADNTNANEEIDGPVAGEDIVTIPCDFDFNSVEANDTLNIVCSHNLNGDTIVIPSNVVINFYKGGEIKNGSFVFEENGKIDGRLLNYQLEVEGDVALLSTTFQFYKSRWNVIEGEVSDETAIANKEGIQKAINDSKRLGATIFNIEKLDAYFNITYDYYRRAAINIPSDFTLNMTDETHIRVQPNSEAMYVLLQVRQVSNSEISGGTLYGDRDQHSYVPDDTPDEHTWQDSHEGGSLITITGSENILVDGVEMRESTGDGMGIGCVGTYTDRGLGLDYIQSTDITVSGCIFDSNRRNGISPGDGVRVTIDGNEFLNSGIDTEKSNGTAPRCAIDIESWWELNADWSLVRYHTTTDFVISNNIERGGANISFIVAIGENVTIENNDVEQRMGYSTGRNIIIRNNKVATQLFAGNGSYRPYQENFEVYGNTVQADTAGGIGISIMANNAKIYNNKTIGKTTGIAIRESNNTEVYGNQIEIPDDKMVTYGIFAYAASIDQMNVYNNEIFNCTYMPISFNGINNFDGGENNVVTLYDNYLDGVKMSPEEVEKHVYNSKGVVVQ